MKNYTTQQAAGVLGVSLRRVQQLIRTGVLRAAPCPCGQGHLIDQVALYAARARRRPGRPKRDGK